MATYYVATDGDDEAGGAIGTPWATVGKANTTLAAGDTVYFRAGTHSGFTGSCVDPANTGTSGNVITYSGYEDEVVTFQGGGNSCFAIDLDSESGTIRSYIKVTKLNFTNFNKHMWIRRGSYNEISYCSIVGMYNDAALPEWLGSVMYRNATYNWVHHCTFSDFGSFIDNSDNGVLFEIGNDDVATGDDTHHNIVEDCVFAHGGHHVVSIDGYNNVFRNNYVHNEEWSLWDGTLYGNRGIFSVGKTDSDVYRNLIEGNRIAFGGDTSELDQVGGSGGTIASSYNIIRKNIFDHTPLYGLRFVTYSPGSYTSCKYNYIYHNVVWYAGYIETAKSVANDWRHGFNITETDTYTVGNVFKNNIFFDNRCILGDELSIIEEDGSLPDIQVMVSNHLDNAADPQFVYIAGTPDPDDQDQFNLRLQSGSPCINNGAFLTTITSETGSGTSFVVDDAGYFMDGWGIIDGDTIQLEGQTVTAVITGVDYDTNTITVDTSLSWTQGIGVALPYMDSAPDQGVYEYDSVTPAKLVMLLL